MDKTLQIAVVGAGGVVGREVLGALFEQGFPGENVTALGSERSSGSELDYGDETLEVERVDRRELPRDEARDPRHPARRLAGARAAGPGRRARGWSTRATRSAAIRHIPVVLPAVNPGALSRDAAGGSSSVPSPVTSGLVTALEPLRKAFGVELAEVTALLSVSAAGVRGVEELERQTTELLSGREPEPSRFPHRVGFNLIPQVGEFAEDSDRSAEELAWRDEATRIWGADAPAIEGLAIQVPTFYGHGFSLFAKLSREASAEQVREALRGSRAVKVIDSPAEKVYPMPMLITADPTVHLGRVRTFGKTVSLFGMIDNAGRGAALNLIEVGELLTGGKA